MTYINKQKHFLIFGSGISETLTADLKALMLNAEILPISSGLFSAGAEFVELFPLNTKTFKENTAKLQNSIVTVIQSLGKPCSENLMYACLAIDNAKRSGAKLVNVVLPYAEYMRQDKQDSSRFSSVTNPLIAKFLKIAGADHVTILTPHSQQGINQYKEIFCENFTYVKASELLIANIKAKFLGIKMQNIIIGAPDGANKPFDQGALRAKEIAAALFGDNFQNHLFGLHKERSKSGGSNIIKNNSFGEVTNKICIIVDDLIDSGSTMIKAAQYLKNKGAAAVHIYAVHGLFSGNLASLLSKRDNNDNYIIQTITVTDSLPVEAKIRKLRFQFPDIDIRIKVIRAAEAIERSIKETIKNINKY